MSKKAISTGITELDADIKEFYDTLEDTEKLEKIKQALSNKNISQEEFDKLVSGSLVRLTASLTGLHYAMLLRRVPTDARTVLEEIHALMNEHFDQLLTHPNTIDSLRKFTDSEEKGETLRANCLNRIVGVTMMTLWDGVPPKLSPTMRVGFRGPQGKILLDSTLDIDDLSNLLVKFSAMIADLLEEGKDLHKNELLDLGDFKGLADRITNVEEKLKTIKELSTIYTNKDAE